MARYNPVLVERCIKENKPICTVRERGVGKTTSAILSALSKAIDQPGVVVHVRDKDLGTKDEVEAARQALIYIIEKLSLEKIHVSVIGTDVFVASTFAEELF